MGNITKEEITDINKHILRFKIYMVLFTILTILYFPVSNRLYNIILNQSVTPQDSMFVLIVLVYLIVTLVITIVFIKYFYISAKLAGRKHPVLYATVSLIFPFVWIIAGIMLIRDLKRLNSSVDKKTGKITYKEEKK